MVADTLKTSVNELFKLRKTRQPSLRLIAVIKIIFSFFDFISPQHLTKNKKLSSESTSLNCIGEKVVT